MEINHEAISSGIKAVQEIKYFLRFNSAMFEVKQASGEILLLRLDSVDFGLQTSSPSINIYNIWEHFRNKNNWGHLES